MIIGLFFNIFSVEHFSNVLHGQQRSALTSVEGMQSCRASLQHIFNIYIYKNIYNSIFQPHDVWTSVATDSAESWRTMHYAPQHPVTLLLISWLSYFCSQSVPLCYNTTNRWLWNIWQWGKFTTGLVAHFSGMRVCLFVFTKLLYGG